MKNMVLLTVTLMVAVLALASLATAEVPQVITIQGWLTDSAGSVVLDGDYSITFTIYDAATGGTNLWSSGAQTVPVAGGLFSYQLGSAAQLPSDLFAADTIRYLGIAVDSDPEIAPRTRLTSGTYTYQALMSDTAGFASAIADNAVTSAKIADGAIQLGDIGQNGASAGQIMKWDGGAWIIDEDEVGVGGGDITAVIAGPGLTGGGDSGEVVLFIADTGVTDVKLARDAVLSEKILDGTILFSDIGPNGATAGQIMKWDGAAWVAADDSTGDSGIAAVWAGPGLTGGGDSGEVILAIGDSAVTDVMLAGDAVTTDKIQDGTVLFNDIGQNGASAGQVMKWNGGAWIAANDSVGNGGLTLPYEDSTSSDSVAFAIFNNGAGPAIVGGAESTYAPGVYGLSSAGVGVMGSSDSSSGTYGETYSSDFTDAGVYGENFGSGRGVYGEAVDASAAGVHGKNDNGNGVVGWTGAGSKSGVFGFSGPGVGVKGRSDSADGVVGWTGASGKSGVFGQSQAGVGVTGRSDSSNGVVGVSISSDSTSAGVWARNEGNGPALVAEGDLKVTGAYRGDIGPNGGAPFPRPAYNSGWRSPFNATCDSNLVLYYNIGGNPDDYVIDLQFKGTAGISNRYIGTDRFDLTIGWERYGGYYHDVKNNEISIKMEECVPVRVRIWVYK